jgi:hypothetical protein
MNLPEDPEHSDIVREHGEVLTAGWKAAMPPSAAQ